MVLSGTPSSFDIPGKAGRYMSMERGEEAVIAPRIRIIRAVETFEVGADPAYAAVFSWFKMFNLPNPAYLIKVPT